VNLGLITPDITRGLGFISQEAGHLLSSPLGLITPDITRGLGRVPPTQVIPLGAMKLDLGGHDWQTWATVLGLSALGAGLAGLAATKSSRGGATAAFGGLIGSAAGVGVSHYLSVRKTRIAMASGGVV